MELNEKEINELIEKIKKDSFYFQKIPSEIKIKYPQICMEAVKTYYYYTYEIPDYNNFTIDLHRDGPSALAYVPEEVQMSNPEICKEAVKQFRTSENFDEYGFGCHIVTTDWRDSVDDPTVYKYITEIYDNALKYVPEAVLRKHPDILAHVGFNGLKLLKDVPVDIFLNNLDVCKKIAENGDYYYLPEEVKKLIDNPKEKLFSIHELKDSVKDVSLNSVKEAIEEFENEIEKDKER